MYRGGEIGILLNRETAVHGLGRTQIRIIEDTGIGFSVRFPTTVYRVRRRRRCIYATQSLAAWLQQILGHIFAYFSSKHGGYRTSDSVRAIWCIWTKLDDCTARIRALDTISWSGHRHHILYTIYEAWNATHRKSRRRLRSPSSAR
jgi:hypothetical protein